ncbi:hypothetical protein [[Clostridium] polysaccharolyticum]|uniref:Uncharacterized protein n=1 Tax=[Clostridium] polysaccharolyticum TaxID=29364 RepID=A0A1H9YIN4_9FIRM|nr:hypothetical protein [[Clostridium] polysaccharolyticum]SES68927.1 hypothetical protein SAMN04487772_10239 [[Clostridium] polysaccharolyticum]
MNNKNILPCSIEYMLNMIEKSFMCYPSIEIEHVKIGYFMLGGDAD